MALLKVNCPECGAGLKSARGFNPGQAVRCPKCEAQFRVEDFEERDEAEAEEEESPKRISTKAKGKDNPTGKKPVKAVTVEDEGDEKEGEEDEEEVPKKKKKKKRRPDKPTRSYKNSPLRFAILGVLLVVLVGLAVLLFTQKNRETADAGKSNNPSGNTEPTPAPPNATPPGPVPGDSKPPPPPPPKPQPPKAPSPLVVEWRKKLLGEWELKFSEDNVYAVVYKDDETFTYTATSPDKPKQTISGRWKILRGSQVQFPEVGLYTVLTLEWSVDGKVIYTDDVSFRPDMKLQHALLERIKPGVRPSSVFDRK